MEQSPSTAFDLTGEQQEITFARVISLSLCQRDQDEDSSEDDQHQADESFIEEEEGIGEDLMADTEEIDVDQNCSRDHEKDESPEVKRRVKALLKNQLEIANMRSILVRDMYKMELEFTAKIKSLEEKRQSIIVGDYEPRDDECDLTGIGIPGLSSLDEEQNEDVDIEGDQNNESSPIDLNDCMEKMTIEEDDSQNAAASGTYKNKNVPVSGVGIPNFWSEVLQGSSCIAAMMDDHDLPVLKYLENITVETLNLVAVNGIPVQGYTLRFHFRSNPFFTNKELTKTFFVRCNIKPNDSLSLLEEPWPIKTIGSSIDWIKGRNVTTKVVRRKQRNIRSGDIGIVVREVEKQSIFNFFKTISCSDAEDADDQEELQDDFRIGEIIRKRIIPGAASYYYMPEDVVEDDDDSIDSEYTSFKNNKRGWNGKVITMISLSKSFSSSSLPPNDEDPPANVSDHE